MYAAISNEDVYAWGAKDISAPPTLVDKARKALNFEYSSNTLTRYDQITEAWKLFSGGRDLDLTKDFDSTARLPYIFASAMKEDGLDDAVKEVLARDNLFNPRITSPVSDLDEVMTHFEKNKPVPLKVLSMYCKQLKINRAELLALLLSGRDFYAMPSLSVSFIRGRPCKVRDCPFITSFSKKGKKWSNPTFLVSDEGCTDLYTNGEVSAKVDVSGFLAPIPTDNTVEQIVVCMNKSGFTTFLSTTQTSITKIAEFRVDAGEGIDWIDVLSTNGSNILYWGGTNHMTGEITWTNCFGIDKKMQFCPVDPEKAEKIADSIDVLQNGQDFKIHGNTITMLRRHQDHEDTYRKFKASTTLIVRGQELLTFNGAVIDVWGTTSQFAVLSNSQVTFWNDRNVGDEVDIDEVSSEASMCVLFAHSR